MTGDNLYQDFLTLPWIPHFDTHPPSSDSELECVIIEPRIHENLYGVLSNMSHILPNASLTICHSETNRKYVEDLVYRNGPNNVRLISVSQDNLTRADYSALLCSTDFWNQIRAPKTLLFQTDSGIRKNNILDFMEYDYIGAPWDWPVVRGIDGITIGNGGFSLRSVHWMKYFSERFTRDDTYSDKTAGEPEDVFFARHMFYADDIKLPSYDIASSFSVEHNYHDDPFGFHQAYKFHNPDIVKTWFTQNIDLPDYKDGHDHSYMNIFDAWIETIEGATFTSPNLKQWLSTGIGPCGLRMKKGTSLSCILHDPKPGVQKLLKMKIRTIHGDMYLATVPLRNNRILQDIHFT